MIIDALANMDFYKNLNESLYKGLRFLRETDLAVLPVGRYEIDGDAVFAPQDAHRPGLAVDGPTPVKKIVVKVAM